MMARKREGIPVQKPGFDVYTLILIATCVATALATLLMYIEYSSLS
ncbi:hypothetical protein Pan216_29230 [Planctomycetes bacterium Pan216]|uniref:Uncharacterized protein n=1 Tax=Kolteria novifilia TaxID=2527975 RepID=A0A518B505_9BACT|nr:hypothetical protein Pan216_29230 [Planctomycetes bacterium Pan216]